jgi:hypothetical protein
MPGLLFYHTPECSVTRSRPELLNIASPPHEGSFKGFVKAGSDHTIQGEENGVL